MVYISYVFFSIFYLFFNFSVILSAPCFSMFFSLVLSCVCSITLRGIRATTRRHPPLLPAAFDFAVSPSLAWSKESLCWFCGGEGLEGNKICRDFFTANWMRAVLFGAIGWGLEALGVDICDWVEDAGYGSLVLGWICAAGDKMGREFGDGVGLGWLWVVGIWVRG